MAFAMFSGKGTDKNPDVAFAMLEKAKSSGDKVAELLYAVACEQRTPTENEAAARAYREAAKQRVKFAQLELGRMYQQGRGVPSDRKEAFRWSYKAAKQDLPLAELTLANAFLNGEGVEKSTSEAVRWARLAAEQDPDIAAAVLCSIYYLGTSTTDLARVLSWCELAQRSKNQSMVAMVAKAKAHLESYATPDILAHAKAIAQEFKAR
jgi:TPR repeat protein